MTDVLTPDQRKKCMAAIRDRDTKPEMIVRSLVHRMGFRYRLHDRNLPGKPDLVFKSKRKIIFVHGCFWHMHNCQHGRVKPKTNANFWSQKRTRNVERDKNNVQKLKKGGWKILTVWECQIKNMAKLERRLRQFFST